MYESHWKLTEKPFENWGDERYFYGSDVHQSASLQLRYAIDNRRAAVTLCGDSGMGKTLLLDTIIDTIDDSKTVVARIVFPHLSGEQLLGYIADELTGVSGEPDEPARVTLRRLSTFLLQNIEANKHAVIVVDEAQVLTSNDQLETLRLLLNLQQNRKHAESAMTLVLAGHTTLLSQIERYRALDDRISAKCILTRFTVDQTIGYLEHRIRVSGGDAGKIFTPQAMEILHLRSAGIPRRINRLADLALMVAYAEDLSQIDVLHIENVHQELVANAA